MKKLFLASVGLEHIKTFVGAEPSELDMVFVPTVGNLADHPWWIDKDREVLGSMGFRMTELDIAQERRGRLASALRCTDIVYLAGGNTFYLLKQLRDSGFDNLLTESVEDRVLYAGASAGALVAGIDIEPITTLDEPEKVEGLASTKGLGLTNIVPIPHYDESSRTGIVDDIRERYRGAFEIVPLTNNDAVVVEGDNWTMVASNMNPLERRWIDAHDGDD